jgi:DNA helicase II / ATP-dependent DNA helicase PcrA
MKLNKEQQEILDEAEGNCVVIAGPGTGKTSSIGAFVEKLVKVDKIPLQKIFLVTFSRASGADLVKKIREKLNLTEIDAKKLWIGTYHGMGYRYLRQVKKLTKEILSQSLAKNTIANIHARLLKKYATAAIYDHIVDLEPSEIASMIDIKRSKCLTWQQISYDCGEYFKEIFDEYQAIKKENNLLDFQDILEEFHKHLKHDKEFTSQFKWVIADEAQDTNHIQYDILDAFSCKNNMLVGDSKQAIYAWRGACPDLFAKRIESADKKFFLKENYRSSPEIVEFLNSFMTQKEVYNGQDIIATKKSANPPSYSICPTQSEQQILREILLDIKNGIPLDEIAVLGRSIKQPNINDLMAGLRQYRIPYELRGGFDLLDSKYVQKFLSILKSARKPDAITFANAVSTVPRVGKVLSEKLANGYMKEKEAYFLTLKLAALNSDPFKYFMRIIKTKDDKDLLVEAARFVAYNEFKPYERAEKLENLTKVANSLLEYDTILDGLDSLMLTKGDKAKQKEKLVISTIHQCKGLEFSSVYVINAHSGMIPNPKNVDETEEWNLAYTAFSRAKTKLKIYMDVVDTIGRMASPTPYLTTIKENFPNTLNIIDNTKQGDAFFGEEDTRKKDYYKTDALTLRRSW